MRDIREGVGALPAEVVRDLASARKRALDLYVTRQEYIEIYYGLGGRVAPAAAVELGAAVMDAEARFHELLQLLNRSPAPDSAQVAGAVARLDAELVRVLAEADSAGAPESPQDSVGAGAGGVAGGGAGGDLDGRVRAILVGLEDAQRSAAAGAGEAAAQALLRLYLDEFEPLEAYYGPGGPYGTAVLAERVMEGERAFHAVLEAGGDAGRLREPASALRVEVERIREAARAGGVPLIGGPGPVAAGEGAVGLAGSGGGGSEMQPAGARVVPERARMREVAAILKELEVAESAYRAGDAAGAVAGVERAYLDGFEPLEARLPAAQVSRIEELIHVRLRPLLARGAGEEVPRAFEDVRVALLEADAALAGGSSFWFGATNAFVIVLREGFEAVLLLAALVAYLGRMGAERRHRLQIYGGAVLAVAASFATWFAARTVIPLGGASRELVEGITALVAVGVLLYVSHWLFQKTYIHDWKEYLREHLGRAVSTGSTLAMAGLAFAAVYREGFETVLFYQALLFEAGAAAVTIGFVPGLVLIVALAVGIVRLGLRLPLRSFFAATNALLLFLAFAFLGKGLYSLQEAGVFAPRPLPWMPDHPLLRQLFGIYPLAETLLAHTAFLILLAATYLYYRRRRGAAAAVAVVPPPPARACRWTLPAGGGGRSPPTR